MDFYIKQDNTLKYIFGLMVAIVLLLSYSVFFLDNSINTTDKYSIYANETIINLESNTEGANLSFNGTTDEGDIITLEHSQIEGYLFDSWETTGLNPIIHDEYTIHEDDLGLEITFTANYIKKTYEIIFNNEIENELNESFFVEHGDSISEQVTDPLKQGYDFIGWNTDLNDPLPENFFQTNETFVENVTFYAIYEIINYEIIIDGNGDDDSIILFKNFYYGDQILNEFPNVIKEGHDLDGWYYLDGQNKVLIDVPYTVKEEIQLYANWKPKVYLISLNYSIAGKSDYTFEIEYNKTFQELTDNEILTASQIVPSEPNRVFAGWNTQDDESGINILMNTIIRNNFNLYAIWYEALPEITFHSNEESGQSETITIDAEQGGTLYETPIYERTGYAFRGWSTEQDALISNRDLNNVINISEVWYAVWEPIAEGRSIFELYRYYFIAAGITAILLLIGFIILIIRKKRNSKRHIAKQKRKSRKIKTTANRKNIKRPKRSKKRVNRNLTSAKHRKKRRRRK